MELQSWDFGLLLVFFATYAVAADEMEIIFFGFLLREAKAGSMLPYIASFTCDAR